jgi:hypothetical protein
MIRHAAVGTVLMMSVVSASAAMLDMKPTETELLRPQLPLLRPAFYEFGHGANGGKVEIDPSGAVQIWTATDRPDRRGARADYTIAGDFQIEVDCSVIGLAAHGIKEAWLNLIVDCGGEGGVISIARGFGSSGYAAFRGRLGSEAATYAVASNPNSRLAIRRVGNTVHLLAADAGKPFREVFSIPFTREDVRSIRLLAESENGMIGSAFHRLTIHTEGQMPEFDAATPSELHASTGTTIIGTPTPATVDGPIMIDAPKPAEPKPLTTVRDGSIYPAALFATGLLLGLLLGRRRAVSIF